MRCIGYDQQRDHLRKDRKCCTNGRGIRTSLPRKVALPFVVGDNEGACSGSKYVERAYKLLVPIICSFSCSVVIVLTPEAEMFEEEASWVCGDSSCSSMVIRQTPFDEGEYFDENATGDRMWVLPKNTLPNIELAVVGDDEQSV